MIAIHDFDYRGGLFVTEKERGLLHRFYLWEVPSLR